MYALFNQYADRYDWHTPPGHYRHDHDFVLGLANEVGPACRLLDVGCGTGVLLEKALSVGVVASGIDAAPGMVRVAKARVGVGPVSHQRMQDIRVEGAFDLVVALSWTVNYCQGEEDLRSILDRMHRAVVPGGRVVLQVAHAPHTHGEWMEDREPGPTGEEADVTLRYRFMACDASGLRMRAEYAYTCRSMNEEFAESHMLQVTDAGRVGALMEEAGFGEVVMYDSWRRDPFARSAIPFLIGQRKA